VRLNAQQARRVREHGPGTGLREAFAAQHPEQYLGVLAGHVSIRLAFLRLVAEVTPAVDHLLRRAAADPELEASAGNQVGRARVLGHVQRVLVAHVDDGGADLDPVGARTDGGQQREGRAKLPGEMVHAEIRSVGTKLLGGNRQVDRLQQGVRPRLCLRAG
jgi:hypothetical protein